MTTVPSKYELRNYAALLVQHFEDGEHITVDRVADLCDYVAESSEVNIDQMRFILECDRCPIHWRFTREATYPAPQYLPTLCNMFERYQTQVFGVQHENVPEAAWIYGALFRSIKPFNHGNAIIGHLLENCVLQQNKLPWRFKPLDRSVFVRFHEEIFLRHYGVYVV